MAVNYGQVAIVPKGEWNVETQYKVNNLVSYDGSSYVAKVQPPVGTLPTDTSYWLLSAVGTKKATADSLGTVMPDGTTTSVGEDGKLSVNTAQQDALGVVKGSDDITVGEDGTLTVNTTFKQATELANIIAGEAIKSVLGKVSKAIATTMNLDENALLKNMISGIDVNDGNKVPSSAYIHLLVERIGMGTALEGGFDNLTAGLNSVNNNLSNSGIPIVKKITDLYSIKTSGFYYYDAGTTNAPQSSRGGMIIANYLSDSWISLIVVPYASSKIYTNTKYNNTWVGWAESATKNDFVIKTYTIAGKAVNAETIADFEPNIALSGYTPLGIVGTSLNAYGSVTLVYADLVDDTKARVRVRNNGTESVTGDNVIIRVLYFKS